MPKKSSGKKKVLALFDVPQQSHDLNELKTYLKKENWEDERDVINALKKRGYDVSAFGICDKIEGLMDYIGREKPDVVFNMCESFNHDRDKEANVTALIDLLGVPYTGAPWTALSLCKNKGLSKRALSGTNVKVPEFQLIERSEDTSCLKKFPYPAIVKPLDLESSEGISRASLVKTEEEALARIEYLKQTFHVNAIVEEYISGREVYMGVLGNKRLKVLPPIELFFKNFDKTQPKFATYKAKWDKAYRKRWGIYSGPPRKISKETMEQLIYSAKAVYRALGLSGYARIDFRISPEGDAYFLEANPNPSIARFDEFAKAARRGGVEYEDLIEKIVKLSAA